MRALLIPALVSMVGCAIIPTQHGKVQLWGDYAGLAFDDGSVHFRANSAIHSTAVRAHWHGVTNLGAEVVAGAIGMKSGGQILGALGTAIPPVVNRPTARATPRP